MVSCCALDNTRDGTYDASSHVAASLSASAIEAATIEELGDRRRRGLGDGESLPPLEGLRFRPLPRNWLRRRFDFFHHVERWPGGEAMIPLPCGYGKPIGGGA